MADKQVYTKPAGRALIDSVENAQLRKDIPEIMSGDTVRLQVRVVEGSRERLQPFEGVVMRLRGGGVNRNFTVRRITQDRKSTRLNSSHRCISYAVFCLKKKTNNTC